MFAHYGRVAEKAQANKIGHVLSNMFSLAGLNESPGVKQKWPIGEVNIQGC